MDTIIILGIVQCLFLSFLVMGKPNKAKQEYWLLLFLVFTALHLFFFYANFNSHYVKYQRLLIIGSGFPLLGGPIFFIYVSSLVNKVSMPSRLILCHFLPYIGFCLIFLYYSIFTPEFTDLSVYNGFIHPEGDFIWPIRNVTIFFSISGALYPIWTLILLRSYTRGLYKKSSYLDKINLNWIKYLVIISIAGTILGFLVIFLVNEESPQRDLLVFKFVVLILTTQVFFIGYFGFKQTHIFSNLQLTNALDITDSKFESSEKKYIKSKIDDKTAKEYVNKLMLIMNKEKPYLNSKLTIGILSNIVEITSHDLSQILNDHIGKNFFYFVNEYRVEELKAKVNNSDNANITLLGLAFECGFNSKSSFNSTFKKIAGQTPTDYKRANS